MRNYEPYDPNSPSERKDVLMTNRLFVVSLTIYATTFILFIFRDQLGISDGNITPLFPILILSGFSFNCYGLFKGIKEWKVNREMAINGVVGNLIPIIVILVLAGIGIYYYSQLADLLLNFGLPKNEQ